MMDNKDTEIIEQIDNDLDTRDKVNVPRMFKVLLMNDDYTTFDFVVYVLMRFFHKTKENAEQITMEIHKNGKALAGTFSRDEAETRVMLVNNYSRENNFPLLCQLEPE